MIALDFAVIPPDNLLEESIAVNRQLGDTQLLLEKEHTVPHISVCMCLAREEDLPQITHELSEVAKQFQVKALHVESIYRHGEETIGWNVKKEAWLEHLHDVSVAIMSKYHHTIALDDTSCFAWVSEQNPTSGLRYLNHYFTQYAYEHFYPHITIGKGYTDMLESKIGKSYDGGHLALYHLGSGCTCQKLIQRF
ncbi:2'-5' RNA ligase family protein [Limibacter armeniacum]|uniref:2'-5' RNA ligase family protein n=1 Tax=Limibacter armeniacum TaxID=466084 RepID=UPI002FE5E3E3